MPGFDGTGPRGQGPLTGGGFGFCSPGRGFRGQGMARGFGRGFSRGLGFRREMGRTAYSEDMAYGDEITLLKDEIESLKNEIQNLKEEKNQLKEEQAQLEK